MRIIFFSFIIFLLLASVSLAATPQTISVQGKLTDTLNNPYAGTKNFVFRIYDSETGGSPIYTEFWNSTTQKVSLAFGGYFSVLLGTYAPLTLPFDRQYWLEMNVEGETLSPRTKLGSTPYAYRANITDNLAPNANASGNLDMKNSLVQNIGAAGTNFIAGGGLTLAGLLTAGSGIAMAGQSLAGALWVNASYLNVSSDGFIGRNLGIGIASPLSRLHILQPGSNTLLNASNGTVNAGLFLGTLLGGQAGASIGTNSNSQFRLFTNGADALTVDTNGNVGIGTSSPLTLFHTRQDSATPVWSGTISNYYHQAAVGPGVGLKFQLGYVPAGGTELNKWAGIMALAEAGYEQSVGLQFYTGQDAGSVPTEKMRLSAAGSLGIGTTSPGATLDVSGASGVYAARVINPNNAANSGGLYIKTTWQSPDTPALNVSVGSSGFIIDGYGNVKIPSSSTSYRGDFMVDETNKDFYVDNAGGKVGIGTTTPSQKLDVNGAIRLGSQQTLYATSVNSPTSCTSSCSASKPSGVTYGICIAAQQQNSENTNACSETTTNRWCLCMGV